MSGSRSVAIAPTTGQFKKMGECKNLQEVFETAEFKNRIADSLPRHVSPDRMLRTMVLAANRSPDIYKCDMRQAVGAFLTLSQLGLEPNTPLQHAFLIPFKSKRKNPQTGKWDIETYDLNVIVGYPGLADLAFRSGLVTNIHADVVFPGDEFSFEYGTNAGLRHVPTGKHKEGDEPLWAYAHAGLKDGQAFEVMPWSEVLKIRNLSQAYKSALYAKTNAEEKGYKVPASFTEAPWVKHIIEMGKKTPWRRLAKWVPKSPELAGALALEEIQDRGARPDFGAIFEGTASALDGMPEVIEHDQTPDNSAAFGMRQAEPEPVQTEKAVTVAPKPTITRKAREKTTDALPPPPPEPKGQDMGEAPPDDRWNDDGDQELIDDNGKGAAAQSTAPTTEPTTESTVSVAQGEIIAFEAYLVDENGEPMNDEPFTNAVTFAKELDALWQASSNPNILLEQNADGMDDASHADPAADRIIRSLRTAPADGNTVEAADPTVVEITIDRGKVNATAYLKAFKTAMSEVDAEGYFPFIAANQSTMLEVPLSIRSLCLKALVERAATLGVQVPPTLAASLMPPPITTQPEPVEPAKPSDVPTALPVDRDLESTRNRIAEIQGCADIYTLQDWSKGVIMKSFFSRLEREGKTELLQQLRDAYAARAVELQRVAS